MPASILLVEDEPGIADTLVYTLQSEGFQARWHSTGADALKDLRVSIPDLVILDVGLPDMRGFDLCREIRLFSTVPILFLTARSAEVDRIVGLEIGADDYVTKPFSPREVSARVRAILRRVQSSSASPTTASVEKPVIEVDAERCEVRWKGTGLALTRYEYRLLAALIARPGKVFDRDSLMSLVWDDPGASTDRTVDAHIKTLRAKLRATGGDVASDTIQTHRGLGYSFRSP